MLFARAWASSQVYGTPSSWLAAFASISGVKALRMFLLMRPLSLLWVCGLGCLCRARGFGGCGLVVQLIFVVPVSLGLLEFGLLVRWGMTVNARILSILSFGRISFDMVGFADLGAL